MGVGERPQIIRLNGHIAVLQPSLRLHKHSVTCGVFSLPVHQSDKGVNGEIPVLPEPFKRIDESFNGQRALLWWFVNARRCLQGIC
jgi:hypothetical protein